MAKVAEQAAARRFDAAHYLAQCPEMAGAERAELWRHYDEAGWRAGLDPAPWFSTRRYLEAYDDVRAAGTNPFVHYLRTGQKEGRAAWPEGRAEREGRTILPEFDRAYYLLQTPGLADLDDSALVAHYVESGWRSGLDPAPWFSTRHYLDSHADVREAGLNPFAHYLTTGRAEGRAARAPDGEVIAPEFDAAHYRRQVPGLADLGDRALVAHYLESGWRLGLDPAPWFSTRHYLDSHGDVRAAGMNPFVHYLSIGRAEGRVARAPDGEVIAPEFDAAHYRQQAPGLADLDDSALIAHYVESGWRLWLDPAPWFSTTRYRAAYADLRDAGEPPFVHYLTIGRAEGRDPSPPDRAARLQDGIAQGFDPDHYRITQTDIDGIEDLSDADLLSHYIASGWREGRDPSPDFSVTRYLQANADVAQDGLEPLSHYLGTGLSEGRQPRPEAPALDRALARVSEIFDAGYYRVQRPDLAHMDDAALAEHYHLHGWRQGSEPGPGFSAQTYLERYSDVAEAGVDPLWHYLASGRQEGRQATPAAPLRFVDLKAQELRRMREVFDAAFYRQHCPEAPQDPDAALAHYVDHGWRRGHDPSPAFSTVFYQESHEVPEGVCPLLDYVTRGKGRSAEDQPVRLLRDAAARPDAPSIRTVLDARALSEGNRAVAPESVDPAAMDLHWIIPDFGAGGGGHMTIFRMIRHLETAGHRVTIWIDQPQYHATPEAAYDTVVKHFQCVEAQVRFVADGFYDTSGDAVIATAWSTAYLADAATGFAGKFYFVQDHEVEFYPTGSDRLLAERSYAFDLACICASPWLEEMMRARYGRWSRGFHLGYDHAVYHPQAGRPGWPAAHRARHRIAVYGRMHTARRCVELALAGLRILAGQRDDFEVHFFGQDQLPFDETAFEAYNHGVLDAPALAALYAGCDVGLCFSGTNYSLVPQEMMACGLPLVELDGESTRAIYPEGVVTLAAPDPHDIAARIARLLDDPEARKAQAAGARDWVTPFSWEKAGREVEAAIRARLEETGRIDTDADTGSGAALAAPASTDRAPRHLDVVIPTYNGMGEIERVVAALRGQSVAREMQIHCIDSSSSDGTTQWLRAQPDIALTVIDQSDFQHGRTRNQGAAQGTAPVIAFLTQDAIPANGDWGGDILRMMRHFPQAAGLFGRHLPYPEHPLPVRREIERHFKTMLTYPLALSKETDPLRWRAGDPAWRQLLHYYSDNNSAMRRSAWRDHPYPEIDYGEDQVWAKTIIEAGLTKLYAPTAMVYHSHDYGPEETYARARTEAAFFYTHFGYELGGGTPEEIARERSAFSHWARAQGLDPEELDRRLAAISEKHRGLGDGLAEARHRQSARHHPNPDAIEK